MNTGGLFTTWAFGPFACMVADAGGILLMP
jgi:hypothetical protein